MIKERLFVTDVWKSTWLKDCIVCQGYGDSGRLEAYYVSGQKESSEVFVNNDNSKIRPWLDGPFGVGI